MAEEEERPAVDAVPHAETLTGETREGSKGAHALQCKFTFWFARRHQRSQQNYEANIKQLATFSSVEEFWEIYNHLVRPGDLPISDCHLFRDGIKPMWEDKANREGGKVLMRLKKGVISRYWEDLILWFIGEGFDDSLGVCGVVTSIRQHEDLLSIWNRNAQDRDAVARIRETTRRTLNLPAETVLEYKAHSEALRDNSSFRNTDIFR